MNSLSIRPMAHADLTFAAECTAAEEWDSEDYTVFETFFEHDPRGCLVAVLGEQPVGICVATPYRKSGFIGELIVRPEYRRGGIGAALLNAAANYLRERGCSGVYLDGVLEAVPLYERNGFRKICRLLRYAGQVCTSQMHPAVRPMTRADLHRVEALDGQAFGDERPFFLANRLTRFPARCLVYEQNGVVIGFIQARGDHEWAAAGPWVAPDPETAAALLESLMASLPVGLPFFAGALESHPDVYGLLTRAGLTVGDSGPMRMVLGKDTGLGASPLGWAVGTSAKG